MPATALGGDEPVSPQSDASRPRSLYQIDISERQIANLVIPPLHVTFETYGSQIDGSRRDEFRTQDILGECGKALRRAVAGNALGQGGFMTTSRNWKVTLAGECMLNRPFAMHDDKASMDVIELLRSADMTYGHLEMNFGDYSELTYAARGD